MPNRLVRTGYFCLWLAVALSACGRDAPRQGAATAARPPFDGDGRIGWQGLLACADCDGIETSLALNRSGERREYLLIETYLDGEGGERFVEQGRWSQKQYPQDRSLIRLQAIDGGERFYALQDDGRLQPRDGHGRRFPRRNGDFLTPVSAANGL